MDALTPKPAPAQKEWMIVPQTKIAFIGYVLLAVAKIIMMMQDKGPMPPMAIPIFAVYLIIAALGLYVINCTVLGHCNLYAWIMGYVLVVIGVLAVVTVLMKLF
jgi:hypothetical protein